MSLLRFVFPAAILDRHLRTPGTRYSGRSGKTRCAPTGLDEGLQRAVGSDAEGIAPVREEGFSTRYDYDRYSGIISRKTHPLYGQSIAGKFVVFRTSKGGVATPWIARSSSFVSIMEECDVHSFKPHSRSTLLNGTGPGAQAVGRM